MTNNNFWDLSVLYESFDSPAFTGDMDKLFKIIDELEDFSRNKLINMENSPHLSPASPLQEKNKNGNKAQAGNKNEEGAKDGFGIENGNKVENKVIVGIIEEYILKMQEFSSLFTKIRCYISLLLSTDVKNERARKIETQISNKTTDLTAPGIRFQKWFLSIPNVGEIIESSSLLVEHEFYLKQILLKGQYILSEQEETIISKMQNAGSDGWLKLYNFLTATAMTELEINGEKKQVNLTEIRNFAYSEDSDLRKRAFIAELKCYPKIEDSIAACLNGIKGEAIAVLKHRGHKSALDKSLFEFDMERGTLEAMLSAIDEFLPHFHRFFKRKARYLGHDQNKGLPYYDYFASIGKLNMKFQWEDIREFILDNFYKFSDRMGDFGKRAFDERWIDVYPKDGKVGGAFCMNLHPIKQSRVMLNFANSFNDIKVTAHELGHAYHGHCLENESILNSRYSSPIAETASIFSETIVKDAAIRQAQGAEKLYLLEKTVTDCAYVIVDVLSRYYFESRVFERRENEILSAKELNEMTIQSQKDAYGDGFDHEWLHPGMWICKSHYYSAGRGFYNYPYSFGLLFARGLFSEYREKGRDFVPKYDKLLSITGKNSAEDIGKFVDIDMTSMDFWRRALATIKEDIDQFMAL